MGKLGDRGDIGESEVTQEGHGGTWENWGWVGREQKEHEGTWGSWGDMGGVREWMMGGKGGHGGSQGRHMEGDMAGRQGLTAGGTRGRWG